MANLEESLKELYNEAKSILLPIISSGFNIKIYLDKNLKDLKNIEKNLEQAFEPYKELIGTVAIDYFDIPEKYHKEKDQIDVEALVDDRLKDRDRRYLEVYVMKKELYFKGRHPVGLTYQLCGIVAITYPNIPFTNFTTTVTHELGHVFGLSDHKNWRYKGCVMYKEESLIKLVTKGTFCKECESYLRNVKNMLREGKMEKFIQLLIEQP